MKRPSLFVLWTLLEIPKPEPPHNFLTFEWQDFGSDYLHELEGGFEVFHRVHFYSEELESHDETDGGLDDVGALLLLSQLLKLRDELLPHCREPAEESAITFEHFLSV